jgi:glycosyltransferase involved in cell wall biosynthesis
MSSLSIITTVLNDRKNIESCINSVSSQNIKKNFEHIIVDAGSKDGTIKLLKKLKKNNNNLKLYMKKNLNIYEGINYGIKKSSNKYIGLLHSDDFYKDGNSLKLVLKEIKKNPHISAFYSNVSIVSKHNINKEIRSFKTKKLTNTDFLNGLHPPHTSLFIKKKIFKKYGLYNEQLKIASDYEYMLRVFGVKKVEAKFIDETLVVMRSGGTSTKNLINIILSNYEAYKAFKINKLNINLIVIFNKLIKKLVQIKL